MNSKKAPSINVSKKEVICDVATDTVKYLVVDDDSVSVMTIKQTLKELKIFNPGIVAKDGQEALRGEWSDTEILPPYLVTLDINMPRMDGFEFLSEVRGDPKLHRAIIFVLSTMDSPKDVAAYNSNVARNIV